MIPELGKFALILALCFAIIQSIAPRWRKIAVVGQCGFLVFALFCLIISFLQNDVTMIYVQEHSHPLLPFIYRVGAAWSGHEGSLLLWCLILSGWTLAFIIFSKNNNFQLVIALLGILSTGFITFLFFTSNPFQRIFPTLPMVGADLTPVLQDPGLIFHPPMLYLGYVGFAVGFAFAMNALIEGKLNAEWVRACRPWIILPWAFLSCGIVLGSWWAYRELGWGGWWFWDPVENASLLPWLSATALIHSLIVTEKRDAFKGWTLLLAIITFTLCLLGTFLVRSGVLVSVHTFANDPTRGIFLLSFIAIIVGGAFLFYAIRIKHFYRTPQFDLFSRENFLLLNSVILLTAVATIVLGTLYPIMLDALRLEKISVGEPYFNTVFIPIMLPLFFLMGLAPHVNWIKQSWKKCWEHMRISLLLSILLGFCVPWMMGYPFYWLTAVGISASVWIILATLQYTYKKWNPSHWSMIIAHLGIAVILLGITLNKSYSEERQVKISPGESVSVAGYQFTFKKVEEREAANFQSIEATFSVRDSRNVEKLLSAQQRLYRSHQQTLSKPGILANPWRDLYLALGAALPNNSWAVRIYYKPCVRWIWFGGLMLLIGGVLSIRPRIL